MKLTKEQATVLASKITEELNVEIRKYNEELREKEVSKFKKSKEGKALQLLQKSFPNYYYFKDTILSGLLNIPVKPLFQSPAIYKEIILQSIEVENLELLINNIKLKFKK